MLGTKRTVARQLGVLVAALLMAIGTMAAFAPANASSAGRTGSGAGEAGPAVKTSTTTAPRRRRYFGAISLNYRDNSSAYSYNYRTKRRALRAAQRRCKRRSNYPGHCHKIVWVRNGCAAVAVRYDRYHRIREVGWGVAYRKRRAIRKAKRQVGRGARRHTYVCTTRYR